MEDALKFLEKNNINLEALKEGDLDSIHHILRPYNVNRLITLTHPFFKEEKAINISIADILGYDKEYCGAYYFLESIPSFFYRNGTPYQQRSIELLSLTSDDIMERLALSFVKEPIKVQELEDNAYIISTNGLHRFTMLKIHYLIEYEKSNKTEEEIVALNKKYTIPVLSEKLDYVKTYSNLILNYLNDEYDLHTEYDENNKKTGNLVYCQNSGAKKTITDQELVALTSEYLSTHQELIPTLYRHTILIPSFKKYISTYHHWVLDGMKEEMENTKKASL